MIDQRTRAVVVRLANGVFPLQIWIEEKSASGAYNPVTEHCMDAPWRDEGKTLRVEDTGAIEFFETIIEESRLTDPMLDQWGILEGNPLRFSPVDDVEAWRRERGLEADRQQIRFGAVEMRNVWPDGGGQVDAPSHPESRFQYYSKRLPVLVRTAEFRGLSDESDAGWVEFADDLLQDELSIWPADEVGASSWFIEQLGSDLLYGMMNMTTQEDAPIRDALIVELGEHRRPGNAFNEAHCQQAIDALKEKIEQRCQGGDGNSPGKRKRKK